MKRVLATAAFLALAVGGPANAQFWDAFNPKVNVTLTHPPGYRVKLSRAAFAQAQGRCADQLLDPLTALFVDRDVEVLDRQHLDSILAEHKFSLSGYVDSSQAAELGRMLGSGVLLFLNVTRCETKQDPTYRDEDRGKKGRVRIYISTTKADLKGSLQVVDLTTGKILKKYQFAASPSRKNEAEGGRPEYPDENDVLDAAIADVVHDQIERLFFSWTERQDLIYYDDKQCGMKQAYQALKAGDAAGALKASIDNVEACKTNPEIKPKHLGRAYYNLGMSYFVAGEYDKALESFQETVKLHPGDIVSNAIAQCNRAKQMNSELQQYEERATVEAVRASPPAAPQAGAAAKTGSGSTSTTAQKSAASPEERLQKLQQLFKKGLISKADYDAKKAEIVKEM